jgi:hypothetical protein
MAIGLLFAKNFVLALKRRRETAIAISLLFCIHMLLSVWRKSGRAAAGCEVSRATFEKP